MTAFSFRPARREQVSLLIGLAGSSGSGKTYSAMMLAKGLAGGKRFAMIDTEAGRALHYADQFEFDHGDLTAPFRPDRYADAIAAADAAGYPVIVVDSFSHEHAGEGGLLDWHEEEFARMGGRDSAKMAAWVKPKTAHKQMVNRLLQVRAHLILCMRAEEKIEMVKGADGKTQIVPKRTLTSRDGWIPICEKNLPYELTLSFLMTADAPGVPKPIKLQEQHRPMVPLDRRIGVEAGRLLGEWAAGGASSPANGALALQPPPIDYLVDRLIELADELGAGEATRELVARKRAELDADKLAAWVNRQTATAEKNLEARRQQLASPFKPPASAMTGGNT